MLRGRLECPRLRASMLLWEVLDHLYGEQRPDLRAAKSRLEEIVPALPALAAPAIELGNVALKLEDRAAAERAYATALARMAPDDVSRPTVVAQLASLRAGTTLAQLRPVRSPWLE